MSETVQLPPLEEDCKRCQGTGRITKDVLGAPLVESEHATCYQCNGKGKRVTQTGKLILDLVARRGDEFTK